MFLMELPKIKCSKTYTTRYNSFRAAQKESCSSPWARPLKIDFWMIFLGCFLVSKHQNPRAEIQKKNNLAEQFIKDYMPHAICHTKSCAHFPDARIGCFTIFHVCVFIQSILSFLRTHRCCSRKTGTSSGLVPPQTTQISLKGQRFNNLSIFQKHSINHQSIVSNK